MRDYDYHPDEDTNRCFGIPSRGVVVSNERTCVNQTLGSLGTRPNYCHGALHLRLHPLMGAKATAVHHQSTSCPLRQMERGAARGSHEA